MYHSRRCHWCHHKFVLVVIDTDNPIWEYNWICEGDEHIDYCERKWAGFVKNGGNELWRS